MFHVNAPRRIVMAAAVAALLGGATLLFVSPASAPAAVHDCPPKEFCLYFNKDANGGFYHFEGSDSNLDDDDFERGNGARVGDFTRYAHNNGAPIKQRHVVVYGLPRFKGARDCIQHGAKGTLPRKWWDNIESYRWVDRAGCEKAGRIALDDGSH